MSLWVVQGWVPQCCCYQGRAGFKYCLAESDVFDTAELSTDEARKDMDFRLRQRGFVSGTFEVKLRRLGNC